MVNRNRIAAAGLLALAACLILTSAQAQAAGESCKVRSSAGTFADGGEAALQCDTAGALRVTTGGSTLPIAIVPSSSSTVGIAPVKSSAGNFYGAQVTNQGTAGVVMLFNATSAPSDGAVAPVKCFQMPSTYSTLSIGPDGPFPSYYDTGITIVFSSGTDCFTKAASATAFFSAQVK
jgi:hypothetical protein